MNEAREIATEILMALSMAWNTVNLYDHEPEKQPAFQKSLLRLQEQATHAIAITVKLDGFALDETDLDIPHAAAEKMAARMFVFNVGSFALVRPPDEQELLRFLEEVGREDEEASINFKVRLDTADITAFRVKPRAKLVDRGRKFGKDDDEDVERAPEIKALLELGDRPKLIAQEILALSDPVAAALEFTGRYERLFHKVGDDDWVARDRIVQTYVEAFFFLSEGHQVAVVELMLEEKEQLPFAMFLDQFASYELAGLANHLKEASLTLLLDYARVVAEEENRTTELLDLMRADPDLEGARSAIGLRVGQRLREVQDGNEGIPPLEALKAEAALVGDGAEDGVAVVRGLFQVEEREFRSRRLVRIWSGRVAQAVEDRDYVTAVRWVEQAADDLDAMGANAPIVEDAIRNIATPDLIETLKRQIFGTHRPEAQVRLLDLFGSGAGESLVDELAGEEDPGRRRALIDTLIELTRKNHRAVTENLDDGRWYVVRNLATILARSGNKDAAPAMISLLQHRDDRVRVEAVRGCVPLLGPDVAVTYLEDALLDPSARVREAAMNLLLAVRGPNTHYAVSKAIDSGPGSPQEKVRLIEVLSRDPSESAGLILSELAERRLVLTGGSRALRDAARAGLKRRKRLA
ncbi:MAG: HEAT repeat domain-containing protein [Acidimicrobiia bacterium]|nr:HEAT repeat domain-containing protein [Acidimicrobiia bacterium]NNL27789.1 HEAT repeat domain-containing protein [Acidimicrobiia bacterium]